MILKNNGLAFLCVASAAIQFAAAQSSTTSQASSTPSPSLSLSLTTSPVTIVTSTRSGNQNVPVTTILSSVVNVTYTVTPTSASATASPSASPTPEPITLDTKIDPAFGVLGAILILTGLPSAFWGHKNRWTSFFLIGFYTLSLTCLVLILKFGVLPAVNPPSKSLRGYFVLASSVAGIAGGGIAIFFWKGAKYFIGAWGGFAFGLWIQCFHNGGVIKPIGIRWILYIGCAVVGFVLCTIPKIHYHILLISTAFVGSSAFILGIDCFTTAGLKEFYIWNVGFRSLFPKFANNGIEFPVSQTMQIELGLIGAVSLMGIAVQLRILSVLQRKLHEIAEEQKKRDEEAEIHATRRFTNVMKEREQWELEHPSLSKHGRNESGYSSMPLMKDHDGTSSPVQTLVDGRPRYQSGVSDFMAAPTPDEDVRRALRQRDGVLPTLDLGLGIEDDVPRDFIAKDGPSAKSPLSAEAEDDKRRKEELVAEIHTIRRSIDLLRTETPVPSSSGDESRRPSMSSTRALSMDFGSALQPATAHLRPPRATPPRGRVQSMELSTLTSGGGKDPISRPNSAPLRDDDWDAYVHDRKLLQPPAGVSAPIPTTVVSPNPRIPMPPAVMNALAMRKQRESAVIGDSSSDDVPLAKIEKRRSTSGSHNPVEILPPRRTSGPISPQISHDRSGSRTRTFEELNERHREKLRDLQAPVTQAQKEAAELEAAKQRWERAKAIEKQAVGKRQAERAADHGRRKASDEQPRRASNDHHRSLSADKLVAGGSSSKRLSTMKVEDWQKYQQQAEVGVKGDRAGGSGAKRDSRAFRSDSAGVPFPNGVRSNRTPS